MTGPRSWLHAATIDRLRDQLTCHVYDQQPNTAPPAHHPEYVVAHPQPGQTRREYLTTESTDLLWVVTLTVAGMTTQGALLVLDQIDSALDGWNPHPTVGTFPAFQQHASGGEVLAEGPTGYRPYSTSVSYAIDAPNRRPTP